MVAKHSKPSVSVSSRPRSGRAWVGRALAFFVVIGLLIGGSVFVYYSDYFKVEEIRVSGLRYLTNEEMSNLAAIPAGSSLFKVNTDDVANRLKSNSWVEDVQVNLAFPHTIELKITERSIAAVVEVTSVEEQTVDSWAISRDGLWLMLIPPEESEEAAQISPLVYEDASYVLHITDVPLDVHPEAGKACTDESVLNALAIVSGFTTTLADQVVVVSATDTVNTLLTLDNGIQIAFGTAENIRDKERVCLKLMEENPDLISYINVRVVDRPTWRSVGNW